MIKDRFLLLFVGIMCECACFVCMSVHMKSSVLLSQTTWTHSFSGKDVLSNFRLEKRKNHHARYGHLVGLYLFNSHY